MINPTEKDIGRAVIYKPSEEDKIERGVIKSFSKNFVFVLYAGQYPDAHAMATNRESLYWENPDLSDD